jgi:hypothetical protein
MPQRSRADADDSLGGFLRKRRLAIHPETVFQLGIPELRATALRPDSQPNRRRLRSPSTRRPRAFQVHRWSTAARDCRTVRGSGRTSPLRR